MNGVGILEAQAIAFSRVCFVWSFIVAGDSMRFSEEGELRLGWGGSRETKSLSGRQVSECAFLFR